MIVALRGVFRGFIDQPRHAALPMQGETRMAFRRIQ